MCSCALPLQHSSPGSGVFSVMPFRGGLPRYLPGTSPEGPFFGGALIEMASEPLPPVLQATIDDIVEFLEISHKIVVLTGAGASTESGIPDFRSADGIWRRYPPGTYQEFISKPEA